MAYNATEFIQNLQIENLVFIPPGNTFVSSQYALYINGVGQTYWAEAVSSDSLNQFSTIVYNYINANNLSTTSSIVSLQTQSALYSTQIFDLSTCISSLYAETAYLSTLIEFEISTSYSTTNYIIYSTFYSLSTYTEFSTQLYFLNNTIEQGLSSLSTALYEQNISTYNSLTNNLTSSIVSTTIYINTSISTANSSFLKISQFSTFSSIITKQLLSTSAAFILYANIVENDLYADISTLAISTNANTSTIKSLQSQVISLQAFSTGISTVTYTWISSYVSTSQSLQNDGITQALSTSVGNLFVSTAPFLNTLSSLSSALVVTNSNVSSLFSTTTSLEYNLTLLTTSSLIAGIYDSFIALEQYSFDIISNSYNVLSYSTTIQNQSIAEAYYSSITESLYASTLSTLIPETELYLSSLVSTLYFESNEFLQSTAISSMNSSIIGLTDLFSDGVISSIYETSDLIITSTMNKADFILSSIESSTLIEYNNFLTFLEVEGGLSTLFTNTTLELHDTNYTAVLDFITYRNFTIDIFDIYDGESNYRITYDKSSLIDLDFLSGFIVINVSTPTSVYTRNAGKLQFDVYRWGIPTTVWGNVFPTISESDYTLQYQYMIQNKTIYAKLLNMFPRLAIKSMDISSIVQNVFVDSQLSELHFWRGTPITVHWSSYSSYPVNQKRGEAPFDPMIIIETYIDGVFFEDFGPYPYQSTSAVINLPYLSARDSKLVFDTDIYVKISGLNDTGFLYSTLQTIVPGFDTISIETLDNTAVDLLEAVGITDNLITKEFTITTDNISSLVLNNLYDVEVDVPYNQFLITLNEDNDVNIEFSFTILYDDEIVSYASTVTTTALANVELSYEY